MKTKAYTYFIGVDVSRNKLDFAMLKDGVILFHKEIANDIEEVLTLSRSFKQLPKFSFSKAVFCMENTGIYCLPMLSALKKLKTNIVQDNPLQIRNSLGQIRGKYDKLDAIRIAQYAYKNRDDLKLWKPRREIIEELARLASLRSRLTSINTVLITPLTEEKIFLSDKSFGKNSTLCKKSLEAIKEDLRYLDEYIQALINSDDRIKRLHTIITSVPSIGTVTAIQIIISTNEFLNIKKAKQFACYSGVAPFKDESGQGYKRPKVSHIANKRMKALLHICAICALRCCPDLKDYYKRKVGQGKSKMSVINAIRYKLIARIFSCVSSDRCFDGNYNYHLTMVPV